MKILIGILLSMMPITVHADIVDGGQLIIGSTATIVGNAFSVGGSTFAVSGGTIVIGPQVYTTTVAKSGLITNAWLIVASTNPSGAASMTFTGLSPNRNYRLRWSLAGDVGNESVDYRFNNDAGANYDDSGSPGDNECETGFGGTFSIGFVEFRTTLDPTQVLTYSVGSGPSTISCFYTGSNPLSSMTIFSVQGGGFTGTVALEQLTTYY